MIGLVCTPSAEHIGKPSGAHSKGVVFWFHCFVFLVFRV